MPILSLPYRLQNLQAINNRTNLEQIVKYFSQTVGGYYYAGGALQALAPGVLAADNFRDRAGFPNDMKSYPYGLFPVQLNKDVVTIAAAPHSLWIQLPQGIPYRGWEIVRYGVGYATMGAGTSTGLTATFTFTRENGISSTAAGGANGVTNLLPRKAGLDFDMSANSGRFVNAGEAIKLVISAMTLPNGAGAGTSTEIRGFSATVLLKAKHIA